MKETVEVIRQSIPSVFSPENLKYVLGKRRDAAVYLPTRAGEERSSWLDDEIIQMAKDKGYAILKGKGHYELSGYKIAFRDEDGFFMEGNRKDRVAAGKHYDMTKDQVIKFIKEDKPRFVRHPQQQTETCADIPMQAVDV